MKNIIRTIVLIICSLTVVGFYGCARDAAVEGSGQGAEAGLLRLSVSFPQTRLAELPSPGAMTDSEINDTEYGLSDVGLYIYYTDDYNAGNLSNPYIRNLRCTVEDDKIIVAVEPGQSPEAANIYIYDRMTVVAFYPYNEAMSLEANWFTSKADEENYPITMMDYSKQHYIPYRAETTTNPTIAFYTKLDFYPKHTYKIDIVLVSDDTESFPTPGDVIILPELDAITNTASETVGQREDWYDIYRLMPNGGGGSNVMRFISYIWTKPDHKNEILKGDILMQSDKLSLIASQDVPVQEQRVYRYGFNLSTGEIFIPTSDYLVHDVPSLMAAGGTYAYSYQVCDIDMTGYDWTPISLLSGRYDGGGHKLINMSVSSTTDAGQAGLFSNIRGNSVITGVNLIDPVINVTSNADTCSVGAICGKINGPLTDVEKTALLGNLPEGLSEVVRQALIGDLLAEIMNSQSSIVASRVENPTITVNADVARVGTIAGESGAKDDEGEYGGRVWDTYSLGGSITVNSGNPAANTNSYVAGFVGLNHGYIARSFTTIENITAMAPDPNEGQDPLPPANKYEGFAYMGEDTDLVRDAAVVNSFSILPDSNGSVLQMPGNWPSGWVEYTGIWPILTTGWLSNTAQSFWYDMGVSPDIYPTLQWERR